jgi:transposase
MGPFRTYLRDRVAQGCLNAATLFREIEPQGYTGRAAAVRAFVAGLRPAAATHHRERRMQPPSPEQTVWLLHHASRDSSRHANSPANNHADNHANDLAAHTLNERESLYVKLLMQNSAPIAQAVQLGDEFARMLKAHDMNALRPWLIAAETSPLKGFAQSLRRDFDAVLAALCFRWSQGLVEGHVHRLKSVKRMMYGRGSFELLRQRVLYKPPHRG